MRRRLEALERRLARLAGIVRDRAKAARRNADTRNIHALVGAVIRDGLRGAGLDPAHATALQRFEAVEERATRPARDTTPSNALFGKLHALAERLRGAPPPLETASPAELLAYYILGDGARETPG